MPAHEPAHRAPRERGRHRAEPAPSPVLVAARRVRGATAGAAVRPGAMLLAATAFVAGSVTEVTLHQIDADAAYGARLTAQQELDARIARTESASTARLTAAATGYQAWRRTLALDLATGAMLTAGDVSASAAGLVGADAVAPLTTALAELSALVDATPSATEALDEAEELAAAGTVTTTAQPAAPVDVATTPGGDAMELLASEVAPAPAPSAAPSAAAAPSGAPAPTPSAAPTATADTSTSSAVATEAASTAAPVATLDLTSTAELEVAAQRVLELTAQVQAAADAVVAAQQAQAAAEEAARQAAAEVAARVAAAEKAPNGQIPTDLLCGVAFTDGVLLRCDAAAALERLDAAYHAETGRHLDVSSSYRTTGEQAALYAAKPGLAAPAGASNHGRGVAVDFAGAGDLGDFSAPLYRWLARNAADHGWYHPSYMDPGGVGPLEPWHWEFGTPE